MKIAFEPAGGTAWQAGIWYFDSFIHPLKESYGNDVILYSFSPTASDNHGQSEEEVLKIPTSRKWAAIWMLEQAMKLLLGCNVVRFPFLKYHKIDVVFGFLFLHRYGNIPILSWIPDFQHLHLPEMFSLSERRNRDWAYLKTAEISNRIILMSESVKKDFEIFAPQYVYKARVLRAVSHIPKSVYEADPRSVLKRYRLPEKFVYVPNQFWKHKNHEAVFRALKVLKERNVKVFVVCTGYQGDYRHPKYFPELLQKMSDWGIRDQVALLGLIPRDYMFRLIRQAVCVLNPSLFEGFGLTVDEARSLGKRVLLSDIAAHQEQDPPKAVYFDPYNSEDLAEKLSTVWRDAEPGPDVELELEARKSLVGRIHACAESFMSVASEVTGR